MAKATKEEPERVVCLTPAPGGKPTRIVAWKFAAVRRAILEVLPNRGEGVVFIDLFEEVPPRLTGEGLLELGAVKWYVTTVKLELEVRGEVVRVEGSKPQRLLKVDPTRSAR
jgi:hypothetical protein